MGLPGGSKTKTGQWSTSAQVLEDLAAEGHELPRKIVDWRQLTKLKSTYTDALPGYVNPETKRVHTSYALASTTTGRLSSSEPNLQNIPIRTAEGRKIRTAFIAEKGNKLISADYSQIELRVLAHVADIPQLKQAFADGVDIHAHDGVGNVRRAGRRHAVARSAAAPRRSISASSTASRPSAWPTSCRSRARRRRLHQEVFRALPGHPRLHRFHQGVRARERLCRDDLRPAHRTIRRSARRTRRSAPSTSAPRPTRRLQGTAADIIRRAMIRMDEALEKEGCRAACCCRCTTS
jgi:DNA polymerase-1